MKKLSTEFSSCAAKLNISVPDDFLVLSVGAMKHLQLCGRSNIVYGIAKEFGTMRQDKSDSRFPAIRMPTGLLQHMVDFFNASTLSQV